MKGMEQMLASMIGLDADEMRNIMTGFVNNAADIAEGFKRIEANQAKIIEQQETIILNLKEKDNVKRTD